jgi:plastocyanin
MLRFATLRGVGPIAAAALALTACSGGPGTKSSTAQPTTTTLRNVTPETQIIADTVPEDATRLKFEVGPITIVPGQNSIDFTRTIPEPKEDGYVVAISTNLRLANGSVPPVDVIHLHHGVWLNLSAHDATAPALPERFYAAGEEKTRMLAMTGYGYPFHTTDHWFLNYMLHNQLSKPDEVWITYNVDFVPASSAAGKQLKPARPIWMDVQNGSIYPVFDVIPGSGHNGTYTYPDEAKDPYKGGPKKNAWTVDMDGTLLGTAGHVHPGGLHDDLWLTRAGKKAHLFESVSNYWEPAGPVSWDVAMTATPDTWRVAVHKGDVMSMSATYDSRIAAWYESMGIMIVWMAPNDTSGADPFTTKVDGPGVLTHGHLAENDNHGGAPASSDYEDLTTKPSNVMASGSVLPIADFAYVGDMSEAATVPAVVQGGSLTFRNDDATKAIPHTLTACQAPCNLSTGIAYPLANGTPLFDSGELLMGGPPADGRVTWSTPTDLPPGTYTYFCRIHPYMRGAFRVVTK